MAEIQSRRGFVKGLAAFAAAPILISRTRSAELARLDVNDPAARALGYVENADRVDAKKYPTYVKGSTCENCLQLAGKAGNNYRPCGLFPGKLVSVSGWCSGWAAEM
jgi:High potential iron-sulfur protein